MPVSFMKKARDMRPKGSLKYLLHSHLSGPEKERSLSVVHASDMTKPEGLCPRYYALHDIEKKPPRDRWMPTADILTYQMGNNVQDAIVNHFADMGRAVGNWLCNHCNHVIQFSARPNKCPNCGCESDCTPQEPRFKSAITGASCGIDLLVNVGQPKLMVVEIKSMMKEDFKVLEAPLQEHRLRTNLYLRLIEESDDPNALKVDTEVAKVLYMCKGGYLSDPSLTKMGLSDKFSPLKEYTVKRSDEATNTMSLAAKVVKDYRLGKVELPYGICTTALSSRAKDCSMKHTCFSGKYPGKHDWKNAGMA